MASNNSLSINGVLSVSGAFNGTDNTSKVTFGDQGSTDETNFYQADGATQETAVPGTTYQWSNDKWVAVE